MVKSEIIHPYFEKNMYVLDLIFQIYLNAMAIGSSIYSLFLRNKITPFVYISISDVSTNKIIFTKN